MRYALAGLLLPLVIGASPVTPGPVMNVERAAHTATLLDNGQVLIAGGCTEYSCEPSSDSATTELYDPRSNRFVPGPRMARTRVSHTATRLPNGDVLIAGGWDNGRVTASAELYVAAERRFVPVGSMTVARGGAVAAPLSGGRVLIVGGDGPTSFLRSAEIYDPRTRSFTRAGSMATVRRAHSAVKLRGGKVLVTGGSDSRGRVLRSAELFDGRTLGFTRVGRMSTARHKHASVALPSGGALILGGSSEQDIGGVYSSVEFYATGAFMPRQRMLKARFKLDGTAVVLTNTKVLIAGGDEAVEVYDLERGRSRRIGTTAALSFATATVLPDRTVLFAGGYDDDIAVSRRAWLIRA